MTERKLTYQRMPLKLLYNNLGWLFSKAIAQSGCFGGAACGNVSAACSRAAAVAASPAVMDVQFDNTSCEWWEVSACRAGQRAVAFLERGPLYLMATAPHGRAGGRAAAAAGCAALPLNLDRVWPAGRASM